MVEKIKMFQSHNLQTTNKQKKNNTLQEYEDSHNVILSEMNARCNTIHILLSFFFF